MAKSRALCPAAGRHDEYRREDYEHMNSAAHPKNNNAKRGDALLKHHLTPQRS